MRLVVLFILIIISNDVFAQAASGIYFISKPAKKNFCEQKVKYFVGKSHVCVSEKPIFGIEEVQYISNILYDPELKVNYFTIGFLQKSINKLNQIYHAMPGSQFVLIIDNRAVGQFSLEREIYNSREMMLGKDLSIETLKVLHSKIKKSLPVKNDKV
jgi:hypothetical protein